MPLGTSRTEQGNGADALQRPLRSRFRARLTASVSWTGHVASCAARRLDTRKKG
jgi:hypothetical protein